MQALLLAIALPSFAAPQVDASPKQRAFHLVVETRGEGDRAVGDVPFVLEYRSSAAPGDPVAVLRARTDLESGRAVLSDVVALRETYEQLAGSGATGVKWTLRIESAPARFANRGVVLPKVWPDSVRLNAADLAAVRVDVVDSLGARTFEGGEVSVQSTRWSFHHPKQHFETWARAHDRRAGHYATAIPDGSARLWPVVRGDGLGVAARLNALSDWRLGWFEWPRSVGDAPLQLIVEPQIRLHRVRALIEDQPLAHATVTVARRRPGPPHLSESEWDRSLSVTTDAEGVAELEVDSAAPFALLFRARGADGGERVAELELADPSEVPSAGAWEVALAPPQFVRGAVVDASERPLAGVRVELTDGESMPFTYESVATDDAGRFEFQFLRPDRWSFRFSGDGFAQQVLELHTSGIDQRVVLAPTSSLSGYLRLANSQDIFDLNLVLLRREFGVPLESAPGRSLGCSCDGRFEFKDLQPGRFTLIVRRASSGSAPIELLRRDGIEIAGGQVIDLGELRVE